MGFVGGASHLLDSMTAPHHAGHKRPRALYDPSAADQRQAKAATPLALVPFLPSCAPIDAVPLSAAPPEKVSPDVVRAETPRPRTQPLTINEPSAEDKELEDAGALVPFVPAGDPINAAHKKTAPKRNAPEVVPAEPTWLRMGLLLYLKLRSDLPVHFIAEKTMTATDFDRHQSRFRLPSAGVLRKIRPMLSPLERKAANLLHEECPRPPKLPKVPGEKRTRNKGKEHGGLPVLVIEPYAGTRELQLSRWDSSAGTIIKGEGYMKFIGACGFKVDDVVQIWAFKETYFRLFGVDVCHDSPLFLLLSKKEQMLPR